MQNISLGLGDMLIIVSYHDMRRDIVADFGCCYIVMWNFLSFPG